MNASTHNFYRRAYDPIPCALVLLLIGGLTGCNRVENDWQKAKQANTVPAYTEFLAKHPAAAQVKEAATLIGNLDWEQAKASNTGTSYASFIDKHPKAVHLEEANAAIESLEWQQASASNLVSAYTDFLTKHREGAHAKEARAAIEGLDWQQASATNTVTAYAEFLTRHPQAAQIKEAQAAIDNLDWQQANRTNTVPAYTDFVGKHPQSAHTSEANVIIGNLDWESAKSKDTSDAYEAYLKKYPNQQRTKEALDILRDLKEMSVSNPGLATVDSNKVLAGEFVAYTISVGDGTAKVELNDRNTYLEFVGGETAKVWVLCFPDRTLPDIVYANSGSAVSIAVKLDGKTYIACGNPPSATSGMPVVQLGLGSMLFLQGRMGLEWNMAYLNLGITPPSRSYTTSSSSIEVDIRSAPSTRRMLLLFPYNGIPANLVVGGHKRVVHNISAFANTKPIKE